MAWVNIEAKFLPYTVKIQRNQATPFFPSVSHHFVFIRWIQSSIKVFQSLWSLKIKNKSLRELNQKLINDKIAPETNLKVFLETSLHWIALAIARRTANKATSKVELFENVFQSFRRIPLEIFWSFTFFLLCIFSQKKVLNLIFDNLRGFRQGVNAIKKH